MKAANSSDENKISTYYLNSGIPENIKTQLQVLFEVDKLKDVKGSTLTRHCKEMNDKLMVVYEEEKDVLKNYFHRSKGKAYPFFSRKSLERYFNDAPIRSDKLHAILTYLGYKPAQFEKALLETEKVHLVSKSFLVGAWDVYVHDAASFKHSKIKRSQIYFQNQDIDEGIFVARYKSIWNTYFNGDATVVSNSLVLSLTDNSNTRLFLVLYLPDIKDIDDTNKIILNGSCLSNGHNRKIVTADMIIVKNTTFSTAANTKEIQDYLKTYKVEDLSFINANDDEKHIIRYLSRPNHTDKTIKPFVPNSFSQLAIRNREFDKMEGRSNYEKLKLKINQRDCYFISFNRHRISRDEIAIFAYKFLFTDEEQVCKVYRHPIDDPKRIEYSGEAFLESEKLYLLMRDYNLQRRKQLIAPLHSSAENNEETDNLMRYFIFKGITSSVSTTDSRHLALREILVCLTEKGKQVFLEGLNNHDKTEGYISYAKFCSINKNILHDDEKLFLANRSVSVLTFPSGKNPVFIHSRMDKARKYKGVYEVFISYHANQALLQMLMIIDELSQVTLKIKYDDAPDSEIYNFHGTCEFFNQNLHIETQFLGAYQSDQRYIDLISDYIREIRGVEISQLTGELLTIDDASNAKAFKFIATKVKEAKTTRNEAGQQSLLPNSSPTIMKIESFAREYADVLELLHIENVSEYFKM